MGRKRKAVKSSSNVKEDVTSNPSLDTKTTEENSNLPADDINPVEILNVENKVQENSNGLPQENKKPNVTKIAVRRSGRIKNSALPVKPVADHVNLVEKEMEEPQKPQQVNTSPVLRKENAPGERVVEQVNKGQNEHERRLEWKVDYLVQAVDEFKTKVVARPNEVPSPDLSYKSLYIDSQKKIEALMEENYELVKELEFARGKVTAYEKMNSSAGAAKEVILLSSLGNTTEATIGLSPQVVQRCLAPAALAPPPPPPPPAADDAMHRKANNNNNRKKKAKS